MEICKPPHNRYALCGLDNETYVKYAIAYSGCKRWGMRGICAFVSGTGLFGIAKDIVKGISIQYGKRRLALLVIGCATYICAPAVTVITKATSVVKSCKVIYNNVGYVMEALEDTSQLSFLPLDLALFGQLIPANTDAYRFSSWSNITDIIGDLPVIGDS